MQFIHEQEQPDAQLSDDVSEDEDDPPSRKRRQKARRA